MPLVVIPDDYQHATKQIQALYQHSDFEDVFDIEPIWDTNHPLLKRNNVLCSPHIGYVTKSCYDIYFESAFKNIERYFSGDKSHVINACV